MLVPFVQFRLRLLLIAPSPRRYDEGAYKSVAPLETAHRPTGGVFDLGIGIEGALPARAGGINQHVV
jgi:hypothetical protein